ncbi:MAG: lecithin retinol acyltransferase family protein [Pirellulaceae bacterium]|nr:lecithin retinol acyltransferase family protein [Pirellulaceae bacterium]
MAKGDHFFVWRQHLGVPFQHHGIDMGDGTVIHFTDGHGGVAGPGVSTADFVVMQTAITVITRDGRDRVHVIEHSGRLEVDMILERAISKVGREGYHLFYDNCEHFASWCATGVGQSRQVDVACERLSAASVKAVAAGTVRVAAKLGAKRVIRGANAWLLVAEAAQWATEAGGHHIGLRDPKQRRHAGRAVGGMTALGIGAIGGPAGIAVAGTIWVVGEVAGEASGGLYRRMRSQRVTAEG